MRSYSLPVSTFPNLRKSTLRTDHGLGRVPWGFLCTWHRSSRRSGTSDEGKGLNNGKLLKVVSHDQEGNRFDSGTIGVGKEGRQRHVLYERSAVTGTSVKGLAWGTFVLWVLWVRACLGKFVSVDTPCVRCSDNESRSPVSEGLWRVGGTVAGRTRVLSTLVCVKPNPIWTPVLCTGWKID